jgi:hypothetical protein
MDGLPVVVDIGIHWHSLAKTVSVNRNASDLSQIPPPASSYSSEERTILLHPLARDSKENSRMLY